MTKRRVEFGYSPRRWQKEVLAALSGSRLSVIVAHRRAGKTEAVVIRLLVAAMTLDRAHPAPFFGYVAPFLNQAKAVIPNREDLKKDLLSPTYEFDGSGRLKIESKDSLKKRGLPSTDLADALALTFAQPVAAIDLKTRRPRFAEMD